MKGITDILCTEILIEIVSAVSEKITKKIEITVKLYITTFKKMNMTWYKSTLINRYLKFLIFMLMQGTVAGCTTTIEVIADKIKNNGSFPSTVI